MWFFENWKDLFVVGLKNTVHYLAGAIRNCYKIKSDKGMAVYNIKSYCHH